MKTKLITNQGKGREIELPKFFNEKIREDIAQKYFETEKKFQPHSTSPTAGRSYSASGNIKHMRHKWKTAYGKGISRVPRKIFWRRGDQFNWEGATVSNTRGGRKTKTPKNEHFLVEKKINKKERLIAISSALASTTKIELVKKRYNSLNDKDIKLNLPLIISSDILKNKTKEFFEILKNNLDAAYDVALQKKLRRAGKGKLRGRKNKKTAGMLLIIGKNEDFKVSGIKVRKADELEINDLWPLGRLTMYTEKALDNLNELWEKER